MRSLAIISLLLLLTACASDNNNCDSSYTAISAIQGTSYQSPLVDQQVITQGVVTAVVYPGSPAAGLIVQSRSPDNDPRTSEGLFVSISDNLSAYNIGQLLQLQGTVAEINQQTTLTAVTRISVCSSGHTIPPQELSLPLPETLSWEALEGMSVRFTQQLVVNDTYPLGRYGEILLADERLWQATEIVAPGQQATEFEARQQQRQIWLDDGLWQQNPDPVVYPTGGLTAANTIRIGDTVSQVEGIIWQDQRGYKVIPVKQPRFTQTNPRPATPDAKPANHLRIASFNVLNFFTGADQPAPFPTRRGASNAAELARQQAKLVNAILAMDADIVGLLEVENNGYGPQGALATLVAALNQQRGHQEYDFIRTAVSPGSDAIMVALIYRPSQVSPQGMAALNLTEPFNYGSRPPLAQSFRHQRSDKIITVSVNHFKSKGSCPKSGSEDADQHDGQACWNASRVKAADALARWLATQPTGINTDKQLILGDLNAYRQEDPIRKLQQHGWQYLSHGNTPQYSYVFRGRTGSLDHVLATPALATQLQQLQHWAINADEPAILDYNLEYKSPVQQQTLYAPTPYRSSDHDPLIATFSF
ncbi:ExeM/NucH family extracellular endonuclease [Chromatiaceae bacterium AAb-1]|nr:ExeM/NucH family extracellular endonuclease [Chromatiaceae bacterium AAb-1]